MANEVQVQVKGLDELERKLLQLAPEIAKKALRSAGRKAGELLQDAISEAAPRDTGKLSENINLQTKAGGNSSEGSISVIIGPGQDVFYGLFQELGTPSQPAQPFIRPAFEQNVEKVLDTFSTELSTKLAALGEK